MPLTVRALTSEDVERAARVMADAFGMRVSDPAERRRMEERIEHLLRTDPERGFVAVDDGQVVAVAQAMVRERLWCLSLLVADPSARRAGAGRAVFDRALDGLAGADSGLIVSSNDPRALRLYARAGFELRATFQAAGAVNRSRIAHPSAGSPASSGGRSTWCWRPGWS